MRSGLQIGDRFILERELGRGGMATVWLARDVRHERAVAIKILHPELAHAIGIDRFLREIRLTARLQHQNIVPILDSGTLPAPDGTALPWYAMAYLEGESLRARLSRDHQLPIEEALRITEAVGNALQAAHRAGIVHRDIKPENVLLAGGEFYVLDFGIAKALIDTGAERLTSTGLSIGTPTYMSPEQASAEGVDARTDQYSLATMLYEMLAGEPPFSGPSAQAIVARRLAEPARPLSSVRSTVPASVERAILKALERAPADRYPDVASFIAAIRGAEHAEQPRPGSRVVRALGAVAVVAAVAIGGWMVALRREANPGQNRDPEVVALYQRGVWAYDRRTPAGIVEAIAALNGAIARDSTYAPAWTALAKSYLRAEFRAFAVPNIPRDSLLRRAVAAVERALLLDPKSADAWLTQALVTKRVDPTYDDPALRSVRQAIRLDSTAPEAWHTLALLLFETGQGDSGLEVWRRSVEVGPSYSQGLAFLGLGHYWRRAHDSAARWADSSIAVDPSYFLARHTAGLVAVERGEFARAEAAFEAARRLTTDIEVVNALAGEALAQAYGALGQPERALAWLRRYTPRGDLHFQLHLRCDPPFDPLHSNPRFRALLTMPLPAPGRGC
ncbi:MAG: protein kinase domain-containing protein [Gemmatimonadales bacterium]